MLAVTPPAVSAFVASLAFALSLATFFVAYRQFRTARQNLRLGLFDRRWKIYHAVGVLLAECMVNTDPEPIMKALLVFRNTSNGRKFLLPAKINSWIDSAEEHAKEIHDSNMNIKIATTSESKEDAIKKLHAGEAVSRRTSTVMKELEPTFSKILDFRKV